jgi:hypothetical protein
VIVAGMVLLIVGLLLQAFVASLAVLGHVAVIVGIVLIVVGLILALIGHLHGPVHGRRHYY